MWYILDLDFQIDHKIRPQIGFDSHIPLTQRFMLTSHVESKFGPKKQTMFELDDNFEINMEYQVGVEYLLNEYFNINSSYHSHYGFGAGITWLF
jgi:hypothetical protein